MSSTFKSAGELENAQTAFVLMQRKERKGKEDPILQNGEGETYRERDIAAKAKAKDLDSIIIKWLKLVQNIEQQYQLKSYPVVKD